MNGTPTLALRGRSDPALRLSVVISLGAHGLVIGVALLIASLNATPRISHATKPLVAKLVRLGKKQEATLLPRLHKAPPPPPKVARVLPPTKTAHPKPNQNIKKVREATPERALDLSAAIAQIADSYDPEAKPEPVAGDPEGDPGGNAAEAGEGDRYLALVERAVRAHYQVPTIITEKERLFLNATIVIYVTPSGRINRRVVETSSSNDYFDSALLHAVDAASPLPPPPEAWREQFAHEGLGLHFKI